MDDKETIYLEYEYKAGPIQDSGPNTLYTLIKKVDEDIYIQTLCTTVANLMASLFMETDSYNNFELIDKENLQIYYDLLKHLGELCKYRLYQLQDESYEIEDHLCETLNELFAPYIKESTKVSENVFNLKLGYFEGPLPFCDIETRKPDTKFKIINEDKEIQELNYEISVLYSSFYSSIDEYHPLEFNYNEYDKEKDKLNNLITRLRARLTKINNGTYQVI